MAGEPTNKVYMEPGGDVIVIKAWDGGVIKGQPSAGGTPAQAAHIVDYAAPASATGIANNGAGTTAVATAAEVNVIVTNLGTLVTKFNALLVACENAGIKARS